MPVDLVAGWGKDADLLGGQTADNVTYVADATNLISTILASPPNRIIVLQNAGAPIYWVKGGSTVVAKDDGPGTKGIAVVLPMDQKICVDIYAPFSGVHFIGGTWTSDFVSSPTDAIKLRVNTASGRCERVSWRGCYVHTASIGFTLTNVHDVVIDRCVIEDCIADAIQSVTSRRVRISNNFSTGGGFQPKFCALPNGDPLENVSSTACTNAGGVWRDAAHYDCIQIRAVAGGIDPELTSDFDIVGNTFISYVQGINTYGLNANAGERINIEGNNISTIGTGFVIGQPFQDVRFVGNTSSLTATDPKFGTPTPNTIMNVPSGIRFRTGLNNLIGQVSGVPASYDLSGPENGDAVNPPETPNFLLPDNIAPFLPSAPPMSMLRDTTVVALTDPTLEPQSALPTLTNGVRLSFRPPSWANLGVNNTFAREFRWQADTGSGWEDITGATAQSYVLSGLAPGTLIRALGRANNGNGWSDWVATAAATVT